MSIRKKFSQNLDKQRIKVCLSFLDLETQIEFRDYLSKVIEKRIERNLKNAGVYQVK